jgi:cyclase
MLSRRIIPCLDVRDGKLTKGIKFKGNVDIGDPVEMARFYYEQGADEIVFYDITASSDRRDIMIDVVRRTAEQIFIPFSVGGGIRSLEDMRRVLLAGAEKVSVNSRGRGASGNHSRRRSGLWVSMYCPGHGRFEGGDFGKNSVRI